MSEVDHHSFKKIYYVFAFIMLFFVSVMLTYFLVFMALPDKVKLKESLFGTTAAPTPIFEEEKDTETLLDEEFQRAEDNLNDSDISTLQNETLSGLE